MQPNHEDICPICQTATLQRTPCSHAGCSFAVASCPTCDRAQAVAAFVADHERDCVHGPGTMQLAHPTFAAPRRAA